MRIVDWFVGWIGELFALVVDCCSSFWVDSVDVLSDHFWGFVEEDDLNAEALFLCEGSSCICHYVSNWNDDPFAGCLREDVF